VKHPTTKGEGKCEGEVASCAIILTEHHAMKAHCGSGGITPLIL
jgi:hypothetical protein